MPGTRIPAKPHGARNYFLKKRRKKVTGKLRCLPIRRRLFMLWLRDVELSGLKPCSKDFSSSYSRSRNNWRAIPLILEEVNLKKKYKAPLWRDAGHVIKACFYTLSMETPFPFTMNLSEKLLERAWRERDPVTYIKRRISSNLKKAVGNALYWFSIEIETEEDPETGKPRPLFEAKDGRPHLHGMLNLKGRFHGSQTSRRIYMQKVRDALHAANFKVYKRGFKGRAIRIDWPLAWVGWCEYALKNHGQTQMFFIDNLLLRVDDKTRRQGRLLYEQHAHDSEQWIADLIASLAPGSP